MSICIYFFSQFGFDGGVDSDCFGDRLLFKDLHMVFEGWISFESKTGNI